MSNLFNISINAHADQAALAALGAGFSVANAYAPGAPESQFFEVADFTEDERDALAVVVDKITWAFEANATVIKVGQSGRVFDLSASYFRGAQSTKLNAAIADGTPVGVRFEFPGFDGNRVVPVTWLWGEGFSDADVAALDAAGVTIFEYVTDGEFEVQNTIECKVHFVTPADPAGAYVFVNPFAGQILARYE